VLRRNDCRRIDHGALRNVLEVRLAYDYRPLCFHCLGYVYHGYDLRLRWFFQVTFEIPC
jgi:hypothetical protein